jgi:hypothetical protein
LEKECLVKQSARQDATFWQNEESRELKRKRVLRENPLNLEKERLVKQNARQEATFRGNAASQELKGKRVFKSKSI